MAEGLTIHRTLPGRETAPAPGFARPVDVSDYERIQFEKAVRELLNRETEATKLYEPLPNQLAFHQSQAKERLLRGSNRAGKTLAASCEIAWIVSNRHPFIKFPKKGRIIAVGRSEEHIGNVMWDKLSREQPNFRRIRDAETKIWRAYKPWNPEDRARKDESIPMTPLVPHRLINGEPSWYSKKDDIPKRVKFKTGWEILFFTGGGSPPQGMDVDVCLAGWSMIYDPIQKAHRRIDEIDGPFHVWSYNERKGIQEIRRATKPFIKGYGEIVEVSLSNGRTIYTTRKHRVLTATGDWVSVAQAYEEQAELLSCVGLNEAEIPGGQTPVERMRVKSQKLLQSSLWTSRSKAPQVPQSSSDGEPLLLTSQGCGTGCVRRGMKRQQDCRGCCSSCPRQCGERLHYLSGGDLAFAPSQECVLGLAPWRSPWDEMGHTPKHNPLALMSYCTSPSFSCVPEGQTYGRQSLPLSSPGESVAHSDQALCKSRQSSCLDSHTTPEQSRGQGLSFAHYLREHEQEFLLQQATGQRSDTKCGNDCTTILCSGGHRHSVCEERLNQGTDEKETRNSSIHILSVRGAGQHIIWDIGVEGNHNYFYGGTISHNCWFDEEIEKDQWYLEMAARLLDRKGRFIWSATAQAGGNQLWNLHLRATDEAGSPDPAVTEHPILLADNPHIDQEEKDELARKYRHDPDAYRVRVLGEYLITSFHVYPQFKVTSHCCQPFDVPEDWCRYMIVDPGSTVCAVMFVAVPPDESHVYIYDELYIRDCDPQKWGDMVYHKVRDHIFQAFIIDDNGSRRTDSSSGTTVRQVYSEELKKRRLKSRATGSSFELGLSNVMAGLDKVRKWMHPKDNSKDGKPYVQIFFDGMGTGAPHLVDEIPRYYKKRDKVSNLILNEPVQKNNHQCDNLRYAAMHGCRYIKPEPIKHRSNGRKRWDQKRKNKKKPNEGILLGAKGK